MHAFQYIAHTSTPNLSRVDGRLVGAGAADLARAADGSAGKGIVLGTRTSTGSFTLKLATSGGALAGGGGIVHTAAGVAPLLVKIVPGSHDSTEKTVDIEIFDLAGSLADPPAGSVVDVAVLFAQKGSIL